MLMEIRRYESDLLSSNMYLIAENGHALVIDPFRDVSAAEGLTIDRILLTHEHYDHSSGVNLWKAATGAPVFCSEACARHIRDPRKNLSRYFEAFCVLQTWVVLEKLPDADEAYSCEADEIFRDTASLDWQGHALRLFEIPGHSDGSIGILLDNAHFFSGDSLMEQTEIELRLPGGSRKKWETVGAPRLAELPRDLMIYPGHFSPFPYHPRKEDE